MISLFRKTLTERAAAELFVSSLLSATRRLWPQLERDLREIDNNGTLMHSIDPDLPPINLALCVFAMESMALKNLFPAEKAGRIHGLSFDFLVEKLALCDRSRRTKSELQERLQPLLTHLQNDLSMWIEAGHFQMVGDATCEALGLKKRSTSLDPFVAILLGKSLIAFSGGWKRINEAYRIKN